MAKAKETEQKIDVELNELKATLANIEEARAFDELTVRSSISRLFLPSHMSILQTEDVAKAHPRIAEAVETMLKKGKWTVPGMWLLQSLGFAAHSNSCSQATRRSSATSTSCNLRIVFRSDNYIPLYIPEDCLDWAYPST